VDRRAGDDSSIPLREVLDKHREPDQGGHGLIQVPDLKASFHRPRIFWLALLALIPCGGVRPLVAAPTMNEAILHRIDEAIEQAIADQVIPGAVLWLESRGGRYTRAYGNRLTVPTVEPMTEDTIFDLASLTKVLATTPAILQLADQGSIDLDAPVVRYLPEFAEGGIREMPPELRDSKANPPTAEERSSITVRQLLTHVSGLPPGLFLSEGDFWGYEQGVRRACQIGLWEKPGTRFRYSDVNFILLGEVVRRVSGERLDHYVANHIYAPLGLRETGFLPPPDQVGRIAPTLVIPEYGLLRGQVHDPTARRMEGVAGHAGLFAPASEVAALAHLFMSQGDAAKVGLSSDTLAAASRNQLPANLKTQRGLGWDIRSAYSSERGERFPDGGFGHTGWTGTSLWADPPSETLVILLTHRTYPDSDASVKDLRREIGTLAGELAGYPLQDLSAAFDSTDTPNVTVAAGDGGTKTSGVRSGIDVLEAGGFAALAGRKIGLITNQTGINRERRSTIDLLHGASNLELVALFSPEHGIRGQSEAAAIDDDHDAASGLPIYSLFRSATRAPSAEQMKNLDTLVFDIQDIGCRFYTYVSTMGLAMEAAAAAGKRFVVLDRINPLGGMQVDGPVRSGEGNDFVAFHDIPVQHGMTVGELATMFRAELKLDLDLTVIPLEGWDPTMDFDATGLPWVNPSPNMRSPTEALLYPGVGLLEFTNVSVGRGTTTPFEQVGAPWLHGGRLAEVLQRENLPGLLILPIQFTPSASLYDGEDCSGVRFVVTDRSVLRPVDLGICLMRAIHDLHPGTFDLAEKGNVLLRHTATLDAILQGTTLPKIRALWQPELGEFGKRREGFLLHGR